MWQFRQSCCFGMWSLTCWKKMGSFLYSVVFVIFSHYYDWRVCFGVWFHRTQSIMAENVHLQAAPRPWQHAVGTLYLFMTWQRRGQRQGAWKQGEAIHLPTVSQFLQVDRLHFLKVVPPARGQGLGDITHLNRNHCNTADLWNSFRPLCFHMTHLIVDCKALEGVGFSHLA